MAMLNEVLPIIVYFLLIALLILGIVLVVKFIIATNKINRVVDNIENKVNSLNTVFSIVEAASGKVTGIYSRVVDGLTSIVEKLFFKNKERIEEDDEEE